MTVTRGTSNTNERGSSYTRAARRKWLVESFAADLIAVRKVFRSHVEVDFYGAEAAAAIVRIWERFTEANPDNPVKATIEKCCRCYRCGKLLVVDTVTVDRIIPGCQGGTYRRNNIRPACDYCNSVTGGSVRSK